MEIKETKYYIKKTAGWNPCILGNKAHRDPVLNVLPNCVGWATGRFNELGNYGECKYLGNTNAENFANYVKTQGLEIGKEPKAGACMVWEGLDGAGHVAIVEEVISKTQVTTSESGWSSIKPFWTQTRKKGTGNWGLNSHFVFKGFIYNPGVKQEYWIPARYKLLVDKALRKTHELNTTNMTKLSELTAALKKECTTKLGKAYIKKGTTCTIKEVYKENGRMWGKYGKYWIVLCNADGTPQSVKL